ncbi:hypothetical protein [Nesterenkonia haasae]|uniref:hypothetical protein n=1 Tax=Nesterenkonia haasae TaxID=2587813 RepID=UPI001390B6AE|nr:hypothetical protein [Nesterenkonia haasae]NDK31173.1 hypothetical protein [Nesterenkonia haasae]
MPGRFLPTSSGILGSVLIVAGIGYIGIGLGWLVTSTVQRLAGIQWLGIAGGDETIGAGWITIGVIVAICGIFSSKPKVETAGTILATGWPGLMGIFFLIAWGSGESETGWITTISYSLFAILITTVASHPRPKSRGRFDNCDNEGEA